MPCDTPPPIEMSSNDEDDDGMDPMDADSYEIIDGEEIQEMRDDSILTFTQHQRPVFCCNFDKTGNLAVSGGEEDAAYVWDANTADIKFRCTGHTDSVVFADFSPDSSFVATAGMDGKIQVWDVANGTLLYFYEVAEEITWLHWHPTQNIVFAGNNSGECYKWHILADGVTCDVFPSRGSVSECAELFENGTKCVIGYENGSINVLDTNTMEQIAQLKSFGGEDRNVLSVACSPDGKLIAAGQKNGEARLLRSSDCKILHKFKVFGEDVSIESCCFIKNYPLVAFASNHGGLKIFDTTNYLERATADLTDAIVKIRALGTSLYLATRGDIEVYDARNAGHQRFYVGHIDDVLDFAISSDGQKILTASDDRECKIFRIT